ncbi:hypothetical protein ACH5RR_008598 [Cinchona calisaya]|uniref:Uncharacterized protein n=1 Tax=Cinchona calisaya TaxID=153742 RepID=A0ABD3ABU2_9GENT
MALVQKLTGLSRSDEDQINNLLPPQTKVKQNHDHDLINDNNKSVMINDDDESTSVVTDEIENNASSNTTLGENMAQVNSSFVPPPPPVFDPPNPCFNNIPVFNPNSSTDFWCTSQPFYNYSDSFFCMPNIRSSLPSPNVEGMKELPDF